MIVGKWTRTAAGGYKVIVDGKILDPTPSQLLRNHSPDGFAWGYPGSGPAQLALALLLNFTNKEFAIENYQQFKFEVVARWEQGDVRISNKAVTDWAAEHGWKGES